VRAANAECMSAHNATTRAGTRRPGLSPLRGLRDACVIRSQLVRLQHALAPSHARHEPGQRLDPEKTSARRRSRDGMGQLNDAKRQLSSSALASPTPLDEAGQTIRIRWAVASAQRSVLFLMPRARSVVGPGARRAPRIVATGCEAPEHA